MNAKYCLTNLWDYHDVHVVFSVGAWGNRVHVADAGTDAETNAENPHGSAQNKPRSRPRFFPG